MIKKNIYKPESVEHTLRVYIFRDKCVTSRLSHERVDFLVGLFMSDLLIKISVSDFHINGTQTYPLWRSYLKCTGAKPKRQQLPRRLWFPFLLDPCVFSDFSKHEHETARGSSGGEKKGKYGEKRLLQRTWLTWACVFKPRWAQNN